MEIDSGSKMCRAPTRSFLAEHQAEQQARLRGSVQACFLLCSLAPRLMLCEWQRSSAVLARCLHSRPCLCALLLFACWTISSSLRPQRPKAQGKNVFHGNSVHNPATKQPRTGVATVPSQVIAVTERPTDAIREDELCILQWTTGCTVNVFLRGGNNVTVRVLGSLSLSSTTAE
ncbi:unnamed protein product [Pleuronectes platessa]|uniref:Uncharacterized protein n=1 Tax=Pleuronectes platessa TaxID=8262 RepID=A0A9N7Z5V1_PLEPL|nr:unnamed protein product [Pleuronectes platessa]